MKNPLTKRYSLVRFPPRCLCTASQQRNHFNKNILTVFIEVIIYFTYLLLIGAFAFSLAFVLIFEN